MDIVELKRQIKAKELLNFYIFTGEEIALMNIYINQMSKDVRRVATVSEVYTALTSKLIGDNSGVVYVVRDDKDFMTREKVYLDIGKKIKNGILVLCITDVDHRSKFYTHYKDTIIDFPHMTTAQLYPSVSKLVKGRENVINYFIERCDNDYATIMNNIDKIKHLGIQELTKPIIDELIPKEDNVDIFEMVDDVIRLDAPKALKKLSIILKDNANELGILGLLYNKLNHCILVEGYRGTENIGKSTGLNGLECRFILDNNKIPPAHLLYALRLIQKYDSGIKHGRYEPKQAVWSCFIEILSL